MGKIFKKTAKGKVKVKKETGKYLAIVLKQNKSLSLNWVSFAHDEFRVDSHTYFSVPEGMYLGKRRLLLGVYLEGISTPLSHKNIRYKTRLTHNPVTNEALTTTDKPCHSIEGLKYDSEIIDILLNRGLAEKFTTIRPEKTIFVMIMLIIISIVVGIASIGVEFI